MSAKYSQSEIHQFIKAFVNSKSGELAEVSEDIFTVKYPGQTSPIAYTYDSAVSKQKNAFLITLGSPTFQQILKEILENGILCQILLNPKENYEALLKHHFKDDSLAGEDRDKNVKHRKAVGTCVSPQQCYHQINNGKIVSTNILKKEPLRYFLFFYSVTFQNKLRAKNEEMITILLDDKGNAVNGEGFSEDKILNDETLEIQDSKSKVKSEVYNELKENADETLAAILRQKLVLFDLMLDKEKKARLRSFVKKLKRERREQVISKRLNFDFVQWQTHFSALLKREEESFTTHIAVKLINLLIINTNKVTFEVNLDNNSTIHSSYIVGFSQPEVTCPICRQLFSEGYATQDSLYVCKNCIRQSIDTGKIYSKKAPLRLDETLKEYIEADSGFICSVCGKRHSQLLEFKCSHDNSSVCIQHYEVCDVCGKVFSKLNLSFTDEFKRHLCPKHAAKEKVKAP